MSPSLLVEVDPAAAAVLAPATARALGVTPVRFDDDRLLLVSEEPDPRRLETAVEALTGRRVRVIRVSPEVAEATQENAYGPAPPPQSGPPLPAAETTEPDPGERERFLAIARELDLPFVSLQPIGHGDALADPIDPAAAGLLSAETCRALGVIPIAAVGGSFAVATARPASLEGIRTAAAMAARRAWIVVATPSDIEAAIDRTYQRVDAQLPMPAPPAPEAVPETTIAAEPRMLGEILIERGALDEAALEQALALQRNYGDHLGELLIHNGLADERHVAHALADQQRMVFADPTGLHVDPEMASFVDERVARRLRIAPLALAGGTLIVAAAAPLSDADAELLSARFGGPIRSFLAPASTVDALLTRLHAAQSAETASYDLMRNMPDDSASVVLSRRQRVFFISLAVAAAILLALWPLTTLIAFNIAAIAVYTAVVIYRFRLVSYSLGHEAQLPVSQAEIDALDEHRLPLYTLLVPLYKEPELIGTLLDNLSKLDYPKTRLDIKVLLEEDDEPTQAAFDRASPPPYFHKVIVPDVEPRTKPKACNYGLLQARGEFVVIYDAEDEPEPDQLKKAVVAFRKAPRNMVCLQGRLNYFNQRQTLLTRWFTSEYSMWFDLMLPGLDAENVPIPLGGTSNHFRIDGLLDAGGWDPFNVTEDADLGIRLYKRGLTTDMLDSTTYEEATAHIPNWIRQRSRWVKGYLQTWLVQMRRPIRLMREIGPKSWFSFQLTVGGTPAVFLLNPIYWLLTTLWLLTEAGVIRDAFPSYLYYAGGLGFYFGNFLLAYMFAVGTSLRGYHDLVKYALFVPVYWLLMSVAAWKGFLQLFFKPFYWEKTQHGLYEAKQAAGTSGSAGEMQAP